MLKDSLTQKPYISYPDPTKPYKLYCDASDSVISSVLTQECDPHEDGQFVKEKPVYFVSHRLSKTQRRYSIVEKEFFAIHYSLNKLHNYLHGAQFTIFTDQKSLINILDNPMNNRKIQRWSTNLSLYNCEIKHIPGKLNVTADFLSRPPRTHLEESSTGSEYSDINDNTFLISNSENDTIYECNAINTNQIDIHKVASLDKEPDALITEPVKTLTHLDMTVEQNKDTQIVSIKTKLAQGKLSKSESGQKVIPSSD